MVARAFSRPSHLGEHSPNLYSPSRKKVLKLRIGSRSRELLEQMQLFKWALISCPSQTVNLIFTEDGGEVHLGVRINSLRCICFCTGDSGVPWPYSFSLRSTTKDPISPFEAEILWLVLSKTFCSNFSTRWQVRIYLFPHSPPTAAQASLLGDFTGVSYKC